MKTPKEKAMEYAKAKIWVDDIENQISRAIDIAIKGTEKLALESTEWHLKEQAKQIFLDIETHDSYCATCNSNHIKCSFYKKFKKKYVRK